LDIGQRKIFVVNDVGQQQVINVTAVTGYVYQLMSEGRFANTICMVYLDAAVVPAPESTQQAQHYLDGQLGAVGEYLTAISMGPAVTAPRVVDFLCYQFLYTRVFDNLCRKQFVAGDLWSEGGFALLTQGGNQQFL
jgi:hypothetical protein